MSHNALTNYSIRRAIPADALRLSVFARQSFVDTFAADNTPTDMAVYVASAFGETIQHAELSDARNTFFLAEQDGSLVGYVMLRDAPAPEALREVVASHQPGPPEVIEQACVELFTLLG